MAASGTLAPAGPRQRLRPAWTNILLTFLVLSTGVLALGLIGSQPDSKPTPRTVLVQRGSVLSTVSATGNVQAAQDLNLRFQSDGTLEAVYVVAGQRVLRGQPLGRIDSTDERNDLRSALADLRSARGNLAQIEQVQTSQERARDRADAAQAGTTIRGNARALADARTVRAQNARRSAATVAANRQALADTRAQASVNARTYDDAVEQARRQLEADETQLERDENRLDRNRGTTTGRDDRATVTESQNTVRQDRFDVQNAENDRAAGRATDQKSINDARSAHNQSVRDAGAQAASDRQAVSSAVATLAQSRASRRTTIATNRVNGQPPKVGDLTAAQAQVVQAEVTADNARNALADTTLRAPADGTVAAVNNKVGELVTGSSGSPNTSSSGPSATTGGSGLSESSSSDSGSSSGDGETITSDPESAFVQLTNLRGLQVKAAFTETDAAKLRIGQPATASIAGLDGRELPGRVAEIDALSTVTDNVVTYQVTFVLDRSAAGLKPGMTAEPQVVVARDDGALTIPTAAVQGSGASATVTLLRDGRQARTPVVTGMSADGTTAISGGLRPGDSVIVPTQEGPASTAGEDSGGEPAEAGSGGHGPFGGGP